MDRYFIQRKGNTLVFFKTVKNSMWQVAFSEYTFKNTKDNQYHANIFRNTINEILNENFNCDDLFSISPSGIREVFKKENSL